MNLRLVSRLVPGRTLLYGGLVPPVYSDGKEIRFQTVNGVPWSTLATHEIHVLPLENFAEILLDEEPGDL